MIKKIVIAVVMWVIALYCAQASAVAFSGAPGSGGDQMGYADNVTCQRNWWVFGALWSCDATVVATNGEQFAYHSDNSVLTPADIGKKTPMTRQGVRYSRSYKADLTWAPAERFEPSKGLRMLGLMGPPLIALFITFRMFRDRNAPKVQYQPERNKLDRRFQR